MHKYLTTLKYVNGPYRRAKDGRFFVNTVNKEGVKRTISYPKFLVEVLLGRRLDPYEETIDHVDHDWTNNSWDNLRIVSLKDHVRDDAKRAELVHVHCIWCGESAYKKANNLRHNLRSNKVGPFCGRSCASKYSAAVQNGKVDAAYYASLSMSPKDIKPQLYTLTKEGPTVLDVASSLRLKVYSEEEILAALPRTPKRTRKRDTSRRRYKTRNIITKERSCPHCGVAYKSRHKHCSVACAHKAQMKVERPSREELQRLVWKYPTKVLAGRYGVSDVAIAKWCKKYGVNKPPRGYWARKHAGKL